MFDADADPVWPDYPWPVHPCAALKGKNLPPKYRLRDTGDPFPILWTKQPGENPGGE